MAWSLVDLWYPGETDRGLELERKNRELNARREAAGMQTPADTQAQEERFHTPIEDYNQQVLDGALEGAKNGLTTIQGGIRDAIGGTLNFGWGALPTNAKVIAILAIVGVLVWYTGLWTRARGVFAK